MEIILESRVFYPSVGGMETVARQLAEAWTRKGHTVQVVTQTPLGEAPPLTDLPVYRQPSLREWMRLLAEADLFVQSGISLKTLPLGWFTQTPMAVIHHNMLPLEQTTVGLRNGIKRLIAQLVPNIAVSTAVANDLPDARTTVICNPFEPHFSASEENVEAHRLLFVGRLVSVKCVDVALRALAHLDPSYTLDICGEGPERETLELLVRQLGIESRVTFHGWVDHQALAPLAQKASIQLVPSCYEPFGIVALEGIAAGCAIVAAETGGLPKRRGRAVCWYRPTTPKRWPTVSERPRLVVTNCSLIARSTLHSFGLIRSPIGIWRCLSGWWRGRFEVINHSACSELDSGSLFPTAVGKKGLGGVRRYSVSAHFKAPAEFSTPIRGVRNPPNKVLLSFGERRQR